MARFNKLLGNFRLEGIPMAPRGMPKIEVTFDIDANGILHVTAKDTGTGREQKIRIEASSGLSKDEVEKMGREASAHAEEDRKLREDAELRNRADAAAYATESLLKEGGDKIPAGDRADVEKALADLRLALKEGDAARITQGVEALTTAQHRMAEKMYSQASSKPGAAGPGTSGASGPGPKPGDVIDAEFVDADKKES
jgi:molecular chaperone DnaK